MNVPFLNLQAQYESIRGEVDAAVARVLASGWYILGPEVEAFEGAFARQVGCEFAVGVGSGTAALQVALLACGAGPGDEVITPSHTAVATAAAIRLAGARPVFVDIDPDTFTMQPAHLPEALTPRSKAIVPVHLYGYPAEMSPVMQFAQTHGLAVIEDCAQAIGARYQGQAVGGIGHIAAHSFYPTKNLGAMGDGGAITTRDAGLAERARRLRQYGWRQRYISEEVGLNSRLDPVQAAILAVKLRHLAAWTRRRQALAARYREGLAGTRCTLPPASAEREHVYHLFVIRHPRRDALAAQLQAQGVGVLVHYPAPVHLQPAYQDLGYGPGSLPESERAAAEVLSLPLYPELSDDQVDHVCELIRRFDAAT